MTLDPISSQVRMFFQFNLEKCLPNTRRFPHRTRSGPTGRRVGSVMPPQPPPGGVSCTVTAERVPSPHHLSCGLRSGQPPAAASSEAKAAMKSLAAFGKGARPSNLHAPK